MSKVILAVLITFVLCHLPKRINMVTKLETLVQQLEQGNYEELCEFLPDGRRENDSSLWAVSLGVRGLLQRIRTAWTYLRIAQTLCANGILCKCGAMCLWRKLAGQLLFSILALPEAVICYLWKQPRRALRKAVQYYCELLIDVNTLCVIPGSPECLLVLPELL